MKEIQAEAPDLKDNGGEVDVIQIPFIA